MFLKILYLILCFLGGLLPLSQFIPFLRQHGFDLSLMLQYAFNNHINTFIAFDLILSASVSLLFFIVEGLRLKMKNFWIPIVTTFLVSISFSIPLFLLLREYRIGQKKL